MKRNKAELPKKPGPMVPENGKEKEMQNWF